MDRHLGGAFRRWALVGAYGDNLIQVADALAQQSGLDERQRERLHMLGAAINYNAYGDSLQDVRIAPAPLPDHGPPPLERFIAAFEAEPWGRAPPAGPPRWSR